MKRILTLFLIFNLVAVCAQAGGRRGQQAPPRLFEPTEQVDLRGKNELLFRWGNEGGGTEISEYQFKLYKGTETVEAGLIKAETLPASRDRLLVPAEVFENDQTYTWQMRGTGSSKTRPAYTNFKVKK